MTAEIPDTGTTDKPLSVMKKITFSTGLPRGTCATFMHDGELWFAHPQKKHRDISSLMDQMLGAMSQIRKDLVRWINTHPEDAARVMQPMARVNRIEELAKEKGAAWTA